MSQHRLQSHVSETVTETETLLRVIEISNIKLTLLMKKKISRPVLGPIGTWNFNGPETVTETETLLRVIEISKHKINIINEEKYLWAHLGTRWDPEF